jgi:hypothetical protein
VGLRLEAAGIDLETGVGAAHLLRKHLGRAAADLTSYFYQRVGAGFGRDSTAVELSEAYKALRPFGQEAVRVVFAQEMERALRRLVKSGATAAVPAHAKRRRPPRT